MCRHCLAHVMHVGKNEAFTNDDCMALLLAMNALWDSGPFQGGVFLRQGIGAVWIL